MEDGSAWLLHDAAVPPRQNTILSLRLFIVCLSVMLFSRDTALDLADVPREVLAPQSWDSAPAGTIRVECTADPQVDGRTDATTEHQLH